ncbi:MAG: hypothetical protein HDR26_08415 [Lachnospiraceae bacterium]|nr:hypothetical protein [Lachnospiraceae bacterium]
MRITNKIMQNNNLNNINTNKILQDKLSTQMSTQKKISRPSEDPVVAIRALSLRTSVTEITQYYSKNVPDAKSWLEVTEGALKNTAAVLTDMIKQCTKGANGDLTSGDREIILEQLKALRDEVYSTGDSDYAGRYVFTGYRTDVPMSFQEAQDINYKITQQVDNSIIDEVTFVKTTKEIDELGAGGIPTGGKVSVDLADINETNYDSYDFEDTDISSVTVHRIRLAYNACSANAAPVITDVDGNVLADGGPGATVGNMQTVHSFDVPSAYELAADPANKDQAFYIPETGEIILGEDLYAQMMGMTDDNSTVAVNEGEIRITYEKDQWLKGDLRPEHYYACVSTENVNGQDVVKNYNPSYLDGANLEKQAIEYDIGFNQTVRVNSTADECYDPQIGREVDDLVKALQDVQEMEKVANDLEERIKKEKDPDARAVLKTRLDAAKKSLTLLKDKSQKLFERGITRMQGYLDDTNLALTNCGTRSSKLALVETRLSSQKITFETLKSENEDIDIAEIMINLTAAGLTYNASLLASGKVMQNTLMNFI